MCIIYSMCCICHAREETLGRETGIIVTEYEVEMSKIPGAPRQSFHLVIDLDPMLQRRKRKLGPQLTWLYFKVEF